jgi:hypothetical protein
MCILSSSRLSGNDQITFAGASVAGDTIVAVLRRGATTRAIDATGIDLTNFSGRALRRAWRRAIRNRDRKSKPRRSTIRPTAA